MRPQSPLALLHRRQAHAGADATFVRIAEERRKAMVEAEREWQAYQRAEEHLLLERPEVGVLAAALRAQQPSWAESEECEIAPLQVAAALEEAGLRLVAR